MPARSFIVNIEIDEDDIDDDFTEEDAVSAAEEIAERKLGDRLQDDMKAKIIDISPNFRPEPKYHQCDVSAVVFGDPEQLSTYSV